MGEILAFSQDQVSRLTGLSGRQLAYWDNTGFFSPQLGTENRRRPHSRIYSYRDVVGLRILAQLRNDSGVPFQELRRGGEWLHRHYDTPWSELCFWIAGKRVFFEDPHVGARVAGSPAGQTVMPIEMQRVAMETRKAIDTLRERDPNDVGRVTRNRHVQSNQWVVAGTRIPTWSLWEMHEAGYDTAAIVRRFSELTIEDVEAALRHEERLREQKRAG